MLDELRPALIVAQRETRDQLRDWRIIFPVLGLTVFFPFLMNFTAEQALNFVRQYGASIIGERMVPFLLMIVGFFPISVSMVIALESFVGEKERGSIEPLLDTPLKDWQLYLGKLLSSTVPPLIASAMGMSVYIAGLVRSGIPLPEAPLLLQIISLTVVQAVLMVSGAVVVSTQTTSVRAANLLASFIIIPVALLIQAESVIMFWGDYNTLWLVVVAVVLLTFLLVRVGLAHFQREQLLGREIDVLNIRWAVKLLWNSFRGEARSIAAWYRKTLWPTLQRLALPVLMVAVLLVISVGLGWTQVERFNLHANDITSPESIKENLLTLTEAAPLGDFGLVLTIFWQNLRALGIALLLGMITFGILGMLPSMLTLGIMGYLMGVLAQRGFSAGLYFAGFILPHGLLEIPAVVLATAAVLRMGAILATPTPDRTFMEVWLACLADWFKVMIGLVIPLLFAAAMVEAWFTPQVAIWMMR